MIFKGNERFIEPKLLWSKLLCLEDKLTQNNNIKQSLNKTRISDNSEPENINCAPESKDTELDKKPIKI